MTLIVDLNRKGIKYYEKHNILLIGYDFFELSKPEDKILMVFGVSANPKIQKVSEDLGGTEKPSLFSIIYYNKRKILFETILNTPGEEARFGNLNLKTLLEDLYSLTGLIGGILDEKLNLEELFKGSVGRISLRDVNPLPSILDNQELPGEQKLIEIIRQIPGIDRASKDFVMSVVPTYLAGLYLVSLAENDEISESVLEITKKLIQSIREIKGYLPSVGLAVDTTSTDLKETLERYLLRRINIGEPSEPYYISIMNLIEAAEVLAVYLTKLDDVSMLSPENGRKIYRQFVLPVFKKLNMKIPEAVSIYLLGSLKDFVDNNGDPKQFPIFLSEKIFYYLIENDIDAYLNRIKSQLLLPRIVLGPYAFGKSTSILARILGFIYHMGDFFARKSEDGRRFFSKLSKLLKEYLGKSSLLEAIEISYNTIDGFVKNRNIIYEDVEILSFDDLEPEKIPKISDIQIEER